jgi:predicted nucleic acid-binding Zn ribbon protein
MESVRTGLRQIMQDLLRARPAEEAVVLAWPLVCGKEVAARTRAVSFNEGSLIVEVPDTAWRNQLQSFTPRYISGYEGLLGQVVQSVKFTVQQSAVSNQHSAKPPCSNSAKTSISTDGSTSTSKESFPNKKM